MPKITYIIIGVILLGAIILGIFAIFPEKSTGNTTPKEIPTPTSTPIVKTSPKQPVKPDSESAALPVAKTLVTNYHVFQTFNNCAPAALSIGLSFFGISVSQQTLAASLRPTNNLKGLNDDKSTPPDELAAEAEKYGLIAYFRPGGDIETLRKFIANGNPVIIRTLLDTEHGFAHYRVIKGYDEAAQVIIQDDSYQNKNLRYTYTEFNKIWKPFNYAYLVLGRPSDKAAIEKILAGSLDPEAAWLKALGRADVELDKNPSDVEAGFNRSVALYFLGRDKESVVAFEKVEAGLHKYALWYQLQPIAAYFNLGNYDRVFSLTNKIFADGNKAYTELYILRGQSYQKLGKNDLAKAEFEKAVLYNVNSVAAKEALASVK